MSEPTILEVADPLAIWDELEPLYQGLNEHHEPIRDFTLADGWAARQQAVLSGPDKLVLVVRIDGRAVGVLDGTIRDNPTTGHRSGFIINAYVEPDLRRGGRARALVDRFEAWARDHGATSLRLNVDSENAIAVEAWRALGFDTVGYTMARELS